MSINPIEASQNIVDKYLGYIETTFFIDDKYYMGEFKERLKNKGHFSKGPYIDFIDSFKTGKNLSELIEEGIVSKEFKKVFKSNEKLLYRNLYKHQEKALREGNNNKNLVVTTGTGSGKTESFLYPILNYLMKEKENNTLDSGVRALIIYPMNALANDQMKRMRKLLKEYKDITFGIYTGETEHKEKWAKEKYIALNGKEPLENERISRDAMKKSPPHILITNYAMLEYLMLRPDDNVFFNGSMADKWKYIVLDEAHTYTGASGIEVSMLLRRVKNLLADNKKINFMLTSATLGDKKDINEICDFASRLCSDCQFDPEGVIMADRHSFNEENDLKEYDLNLYKELNPLINKGVGVNQLEDIFEKYDIELKKSKDVKEILFDIVKEDKNYYKIRKQLQNNPETINLLSDNLGIRKEEVVNFIEVASKAEKDSVKLLDAKYHMFIRALEGVYISLPPYKSLSIVPTKKMIVNNKEVVAYNASVCKFCGQIYIKGLKDEDNRLVQLKSVKDTNCNVYMLLNKQRKEELEEKELEKVYKLCSICGKMELAGKVKSRMCDCGEENINEILEVKEKEGVLKKCGACETNSILGTVLREFYVGQEAATSVVCSSLYEELPSKEYEVIETKINYDNDFFGEDISCNTKEDIIEKRLDKQLLAFSDSRQDAAYFATYFDFTYNNLLKRRLIVEALRELEEFIKEDGIEIYKVVEKLKDLFKKYNIVSEEKIEKEAWKSILYEMTCGDRNSLENMGVISFEYESTKRYPKLGPYEGEDAKALQRVLANSFRKEGALNTPIDSKLTQSDREDFLFNGIEMDICLNGADKGKYTKTWLPNDKRDNYRSKYIKRTLQCEREISDKVLSNIWNGIYIKDDELLMKKPGTYVMKINRFKIKVSKDILNNRNNGNDITWYCCDKCGKLTVNNIKSICPQARCGGELKNINVEEEFKSNHYRVMYKNLDIAPMVIKEHTAQLSPTTAQEYQKDFVEKKINILSCSTTFEMGVDVGELETVFMKNMPPTPANYIQRAGRAGRRSDSTAYSLTFCKLSSHDLTYFKHPNKMIKGKIKPPKFKIENEKIVKRHVQAAVISKFWKVYPDKYKNAQEFFDKDNYNMLIEYIKNIPASLSEYLKAFVPRELSGKVGTWLKELVDDKSILAREYENYHEEIENLEKLKAELKSGDGDIGFQLIRVENYLKTIKNEDVLQFLSRKNIIPKYGFPVDTVELTASLTKNSIQSFDKGAKLRLQRDLMIAIADYAPESQVIADGKIYTSSFIKKSRKNEEWFEYAYGVCKDEKCKHMNVKLNVQGENSRNLGICKGCGQEVDKNGVFLIPQYGFVIGENIEEAKTKKPTKTYLSEIFYIGDPKEKQETEKIYGLNGRELKIKSTENDELLILNTSDFLVCRKCGFSIVKKKGSVSNKKHKNPYGYWCEEENLIDRQLGHNLKTDVAHISIDDRLDHNRALSILYALLEGASSLLEIERNDISGCIDYRKVNGVVETIFILFDTVPGGAGHVRRIGLFDRDDLKKLFEKALKIVKQCNCGEKDGDSACYSCLCNYYNQKHHDFIKRRYAIEFLEETLSRF